jgi:hypothetical protein
MIITYYTVDIFVSEGGGGEGRETMIICVYTVYYFSCVT